MQLPKYIAMVYSDPNNTNSIVYQHTRFSY